MNREQLKNKISIILSSETTRVDEMLENIMQCADSYKEEKPKKQICTHQNRTQHFSDTFGHYTSCLDCGKDF